MSKKTTSFKRRLGKLRYKRRYVLICEGTVTEPDYFNQLNTLYRESIIDITCLKKQGSAPEHLIECALKAEAKSLKDDEIWIILDVDEWTQDQFAALEKWKEEIDRRYVAVSNPCFEIWLVFHEKDLSNYSKAACQKYFKENIAHKNKGIRINWLTSDKVKYAVTRAKQKDFNGDKIIPDAATSRVYKLIDNIEEFCNEEGRI